MRRQEFNVCQASHLTHASKTVDTVEGPFHIWDWEQYGGYAGYCTGQDDVSMTLDLYGTWEAPDFDLAMSVIRPGDVVWDFGSHIGWYTAGAQRRGGKVWAVDADPENMRLLRDNTELLWSTVKWVADVDTFGEPEVRLIKADVEGAENEVLRIAEHLLEQRKVDFLLVECSPEFDTYYPALIDQIIGYGYTASINGHQITGKQLGNTQKNVWFECA